MKVRCVLDTFLMFYLTAINKIILNNKLFNELLCPYYYNAVLCHILDCWQNALFDAFLIFDSLVTRPYHIV